MKVSQIIYQLAKTSSKNVKLAFLKENADNQELKLFFKAALDPFATYFIKKIPGFTPASESKISLTEAIQHLDALRLRQVTGFAGIDFLKSLLEQLDLADADMLIRVVRKDTDCGCQRSSANATWPGLIMEFPVLLCSAFSQKLIDKLNWKRGVIVQLKSDGARCLVVVDDNGGVTAFTRAGREIDTKGQFDFLGDFVKSVMIDGELLCADENGDPLPRKIGNGIVNKCIKGTITDEDAKQLYLSAWDIIPLKDYEAEVCRIECIDRLDELSDVVARIQNPKLRLIPYSIVHSPEEAAKIYNKYIEDGEEGAVYKDQDAPWESTRSKKQIKMKAEEECDLEIFEYQEGTGKHEGKMGALACKTRDGKLIVSVGGGWSDQMRAQIKSNIFGIPVSYQVKRKGIVETVWCQPIPEDNPMGKILVVKYNMKIESDGVWSLFLPRTINGGQIREDKTVADSFEEVV